MFDNYCRCSTIISQYTINIFEVIKLDFFCLESELTSNQTLMTSINRLPEYGYSFAHHTALSRGAHSLSPSITCSHIHPPPLHMDCQILHTKTHTSHLFLARCQTRSACRSWHPITKFDIMGSKNRLRIKSALKISKLDICANFGFGDKAKFLPGAGVF